MLVGESIVAPRIALNEGNAMKATSLLERSDDAYSVVKPSEILRLMQDLQREQKSVVLVLPRGHKVVTVLLNVDENSGHFLYDCGRNREETQAVLSAGQIHFSAALHGVSLRFTMSTPIETVFSGAPAFLSPLPLEIHYLQRREHYRAMVRVIRSCTCTAQLADRETISLNINNLSLGGVELQSNTISPETLPVGTLLRDAVLDFFERGKLDVRLRVIAHRKMENGGLSTHFYGCQFEQLPRSKEAIVQRLVFSLETLNRPGI